ncbi:hypothetical protein C2E23DRAFT_834080 [Lenzites betulinus]|nr:hypothetical protein C2E23DRAFT_834080 [Lenzites betulinus]
MCADIPPVTRTLQCEHARTCEDLSLLNPSSSFCAARCRRHAPCVIVGAQLVMPLPLQHLFSRGHPSGALNSSSKSPLSTLQDALTGNALPPPIQFPRSRTCTRTPPGIPCTRQNLSTASARADSWARSSRSSVIS